MHVIAIEPYKYWRNIKTGQKVSIHGACPWTNDNEKPNWEIVERGYTQVWSNNTTRNSGPLNECRAQARRINLARVHQLRRHAELYPETAAECKAKIREIPAYL